MNFWNCIGNFFLIRWIFGKLRRSAAGRDMHTGRLGTSDSSGGECLNDNHCRDTDLDDDADTHVGYNLNDDSDSSEDLDDLDLFMRENNRNDHSCRYPRDFGRDYHESGRRSNNYDWYYGSHDQSYDDIHDDFHDEQDDFDLMDDDF